MHYSFAEAELAVFAETHNIPVVETVAGKASLLASHPMYAGPIGVTGCEAASNLAAEADVVVAVGTRLEDFTTGSWTVFKNADVKIVGITARWDATKHLALPVVGDAREALTDLTGRIGDYERSSRGATRRRPRCRSTTPTSTRSPRLMPTGTNSRVTPKSWCRRSVGRPRRFRPGCRGVSRVRSTMVGVKRSTASTASTATRLWDTRSPVRGARSRHCPNGMLSLSWETART